MKSIRTTVTLLIILSSYMLNAFGFVYDNPIEFSLERTTPPHPPIHFHPQVILTEENQISDETNEVDTITEDSREEEDDDSIFIFARHLLNAASIISEDTEDNDSETIFQAVTDGDIRAVCTFIRSGRDPNISNNEETSLLHHAVTQNQTAIVRELLQAPGILVNTQNLASYTALHIAARNGNAIIVQLLLNSGANPNARGGYSLLTPLTLARRNGNPEAIRILEAATAHTPTEEFTHSAG